MTLTALRDDALTSTAHGFRLRLGLPWIRSLPIASLRALVLSIDDEPLASLAVELARRAVHPSDLWREDAWWFLQDRVVLSGDRALEAGAHRVAVSFELVVPYLQNGPDGPLSLPFRIARPLVLDAISGAPSVSRDVT